MNRDKQIEELVDFITSIDNNGYAYDNDGYEIFGYADSRKIAEALVNADYRKTSDVVREIFGEIEEGFSQIIEEAENTILDAIQEENKSVARIAEYGRDVLLLARNTLTKILKKKYESEGGE